MQTFVTIQLVILILGSSCAPWSMVGGKYASDRDSYQVELPQGWRKQEFSREGLIITKDGMALQRVTIGRHPIDKDVPHTKRKLAKEMLPQEVAELIIDDFRSIQRISNLNILENIPVQVGGNPGFKIVYSFQTKDNLRKMGTYYGVLHKESLYFLMYEAPARHYFNRDQQTFEKIKESFKITA